MNVMREIHIRPVLNGFIVNVGCQALVYRDMEELAKDLVRYQQHPAEMEKAFIERAVNKTIGPLTEPPLDQPNRHNGFGDAPDCAAVPARY